MSTTAGTDLAQAAADDYAAGRADHLAGHCDVERAVASPDYRRGQAEQRTEDVDAELLAAVERGELQPICSPGSASQG